jgi:hypothetical protein
MRDFFIEKLKMAEMEIKSLMTAQAALKRQANSDQEIIAYLDLKGNEMESQKQELLVRTHQLQASLDLQIGSHSHKVIRLFFVFLSYVVQIGLRSLFFVCVL